MPRLSVWMVRLSLIYFGAGFTFGALMLWNKGLPVAGAVWRLLPLHVELALVGWTVQLAMGVAFWILPRFGGERPRAWLAWLAFGLLNAGVLAVCAGRWWPRVGGLIAVGRIAEALGVAAFAGHAWPRIKPPGVR